MPEGFPAPRGRSIIEHFEDELDTAYVAMQSAPYGLEHGVARERCQVLSEVVAYIRNPYSPNTKAEKLAAKERYENAQADA